MMSLLEGHGDVIMDRAGAGEVPGAAHFSQVLHERRTNAQGLTKLMSKLLGLDAKMRQYAEGEQFVTPSRRPAARRCWPGCGGPRVAAHPRGDPRPRRLGGPGRWLRGRRGLPPRRPAHPVHLPAARDPAGLRRLGRSRFPGPAAAGRRGRVRGDARYHVDHGLRPGSAGEAEVVAERGRPGSGPASRPARCRGAGAQPRGPGPGGALRRAASGRGHRAHHGRPGRDHPAQPAARRGRRRPGRHGAGHAPPLARAAPGRDPRALRRRRPRAAVSTRATPTPPSPATGSATNCCRCAPSGGARPGAAAGPPGRAAPRRGGTARLRWPARRCPNPPTPGPWPRPAVWPGGPCAVAARGGPAAPALAGRGGAGARRGPW